MLDNVLANVVRQSLAVVAVLAISACSMRLIAALSDSSPNKC